MGAATSPNGLAWTLVPTNPIVDFTEAFDGNVYWCWPLGIGLGNVGGYLGYIAGYRGRSQKCEIYAMDAADALSWTPRASPLLEAGDSGEWDDCGYVSMSISRLDGVDYMFYVGFGDWETHPGYVSTLHLFLGLATSTDGQTWQKVAGPLPISNTAEGLVTAVASQTVGRRIHLWITDQWSGVTGVGYFLFDPERAAAEDAQ
jgi:hypothetical protein